MALCVRVRLPVKLSPFLCLMHSIEQHLFAMRGAKIDRELPHWSSFVTTTAESLNYIRTEEP